MAAQTSSSRESDSNAYKTKINTLFKDKRRESGGNVFSRERKGMRMGNRFFSLYGAIMANVGGKMKEETGKATSF